MISMTTLPSWKEGGFWRDGSFGFLTKGAWRFMLLAATLAAPRSASASGETLSYNNQIGPLLSEHCFRCHGPDSASRKPKKHPLRLDRQDFAYELRDDGKPVIIKGSPGASELVRRISATDDDVMPPVSEHNPLKPAEIAMIRQWITQGGKYEKHWAL